jgi:secreted PhoX family phosphatase
MEGIVNPDNIAIEPVTGRVFIQEDRYDEFMAPTEGMPNASLWIAETDGTINRFANMPFASEVTGGAFAPDGTLFFNVQHPEIPWVASVVQVIAPK